MSHCCCKRIPHSGRFKRNRNDLSSKEIIKIREKYNLNQGEFADLLGVGKITIHRYEHTQVQTEAVDSMIRIANDPDVMYYMLVTNKDKLLPKKYDETLEIIQKLKNEDSHSLVDINRFENSFRIKTTDVDKVVNTLRNKYHSIIINSNDEMENDLSPIKLLKLIYYVQAITLKKTGKKAYNEDIEAWNPNIRSKSAIRTTPTRHFVDTSIAASVLGVSPSDLINDLNTFGLFFEDMAVRDLGIYASYLDGAVKHYRDSSGLECDAVLHLRNGKWASIEIKLSGEKLIEEGAASLRKLKKTVNEDNLAFQMILTATGPAYRRKDGIYVVPIDCLTV